jgi:glycosyltransferase involved in cell wall biosynthesis
VVASQNCGCVPDIVKDGVNGYSFDPSNTEKLKSLLLKFSQKQVNLEAMKENSTKIIKDYTPEKAADVIKKTINILNESN